MNWDRPIVITGAREHNLKNITVSLPREAFIVITGISGSGKSTLAFDIIYAEGQRKYIESLSAYARQFLERMQKPDVDEISGLSPTIAIEQRKAAYNPRSTVGTVTEIYDYLRLLFARAGKAYCPRCDIPIESMSAEEIVQRIFQYYTDQLINIYSPVVRGRKGEFKREFQAYLRQGFVKFRIDGKVTSDPLAMNIDKKKKHHVEVLVDEVEVVPEERGRVFESVALALDLSGGLVCVETQSGAKETWSEKYACPQCGFTFSEISPRTFSFNSPYGACPSCSGLGTLNDFDPLLVVPDESLSLREGAIAPFRGRNSGFYTQMLQCVADHFGFDTDVPFRELPEYVKKIIFYGSGDEEIDFYIRTDRTFYFTRPFEGVIPLLERRYRETESMSEREELERFMRHRPCPDCGGSRLKREYLHVKFSGKNIHELSDMSAFELRRFLSSVKLEGKEKIIAEKILAEVIRRLSFMEDVGLGYLSLSRPVHTLSGGEYQRTKLATQVGSGLVGVIYVLDEPSIGLHPRDTWRLLKTLKGLRDLGNTIIVVDHDMDTIRQADWILDLGPGAGEAGGYVVVEGPPDDVAACDKSYTGQYLSGRLKIEMPSRRRHPRGYIWLKGCTHHNLKNIDVRIPLGVFVCVTGVSGSGKSTLVMDILYPALKGRLTRSRVVAGAFKTLEGWDQVDRVIEVDQSPIGRTPRSNPVTYIGAFTPIRELFAKTREARMKGYRPGHFSFNVKGGRCEACKGDGYIKIDMQFMPDVYVKCDVCGGKRFHSETLEVRFKGKNIYEVLELTVDEALELFNNIPAVKRKLGLLQEVGLGYIKLGQPAPTLSGGESQRIKLARELSKRDTGRTLYILDEPTIGLHAHDVSKLLKVLERLVDAGNTVVVIEHNLDVVKCADWIIDLGPEGGENGGRIVAEGAPEEVMQNPNSYTAEHLRMYLSLEKRVEQGTPA